MEGNNRRKSKLTLINNDCRNEDPIYISNYDSKSPKENKKTKNPVKYLVLQTSSSDESDQENKNFGKKSKSKCSTQNSSTKILHKSGKDLGLSRVDSSSKSPKQSVGETSRLSDSWKPIVVLEKMLIENENLIPSDKKSVSKIEEIPTPKTPQRKHRSKTQKLLDDLSDTSDISSVSTERLIKDNKTPSNTQISNDSSRRSGRARKMSIKALESSQSPVKWRRKKVMPSTSSSESEFEVDSDIEKPTALFESKDIEGKQIYGFQTPKKRNALLQKALFVANNSPMSVLQKETEKISLTPRTPKSTSKKMDMVKTPAAVRNKYRKVLADVVRELEDEDFSDYSLSESDFMPSNSSTSSSSESESTESEQRDEIIPVTPKHNTRNVRSTRKNHKEITYSLQSDDYFSTHSSKVFTSDNTLDKLKNPRLTQDKINDILQNVKVNREHAQKIVELLKDYETNFEKWMFLMYEGHFSILLYGLGSKRTILEHFRLYLQNEQCPVIFINGFFPSIVVKDVIDVIANDLLRLKDISSNSLEVIDEIDVFLKNNNDVHIFLIICNIDGEMLRSSKTQNILSKLASIKNVHLIASIDDINAPLIWDHKKLNRLNFTWWDTTTFLPYAEETSFEGSLLVQKSGTLTLSSLKNIFQSLTTNARGIFNIIIKHHLENKKDAHYQGISFKDLYWSCREAFLVSSDIALRAQLTEFLDHKLIKSKRNLDGAELLQIPIEGSLLQHFLDYE